MKKQSLFLFALCCLTVGCKSPDVAKTGEPSDQTPSPTATSDPAASTAVAIPDEVRTEGFAYYGVDQKQPLNMELVKDGVTTNKGAIEFKLLEVKDGKLTFEQSYTGDLAANFGTSKLFADKTGVYGTELLGATLGEPQLEMPATASPGVSWKMPKPIKTASFTILEMSNKIVGRESITVPLGKFESLKMVSSAKLSQSGTISTATMTAWLVKDIGMVKLVIKTVSGGKSVEQTLRATK
ncbi:MAG: hypothetical protein ABL962_02845 [Fimbriimonadaceae bacterium]